MDHSEEQFQLSTESHKPVCDCKTLHVGLYRISSFSHQNIEGRAQVFPEPHRLQYDQKES